MSRTGLTAVALVLVASAAPVARSAVTDATSLSTTSESAFDNLIQSTDLINSGRATLASATYSNLGDFGFASSNLIDGTANSAFYYVANNAVAGQPNGNYPVTATFALNTNPLTGGSATGYTINTVNSIAGYGGLGGLGNQSFTLSYSTVLNPTAFTTVGTFSYTPATASGTEATVQSLSDSSGGSIADGVAAVRFVLNDPTAIQPIAGGDNKGTVYRELDVVGVPTTVAAPEPTSLSLLAVGATGLLGRRRRSRAGR